MDIFFKRFFKTSFFLFCFLFFFIFSITAKNANDNTSDKSNNYQFRLFFDVQSHPFYYDFILKMYGTSLNTSILFGFKVNNFTVGQETYIDYYSFDNKDQVTVLKGAWFNIKPFISFYYQFNQLLELKWGIGGIWLRSAFLNNNLNWLILSQGGISFLVNLKIYVWKYINLEIINKLDLIFLTSPQIYGVSPYYLGGLRVNFNPKITWMNIYIELDGIYWNYNNSGTVVNTGTVLYSTGISFDISLPKVKEKIIIKDNTTDINKKDDSYTTLSKAIINDKITFKNIIFETGNDNLLPNSQKILDKISGVLLKNTRLVILISSYSEYLGNPLKEFQLCKLRSTKIKEYLISKGINEKRIKISSTGQIIKEDQLKKGFLSLIITVLADDFVE